MLAGDVVCERRLYGSVATPEPYFARFLPNFLENPAFRIQPICGRLLVNKRLLAVNELITFYRRT